jgi:hypothetical protein
MHYSEAPRLEQPEEAAPRPYKYDDDIAFKIMERLGDGEALHDICRSPGMPHPVTFYRWLSENEGLGKSYDAALLARFDKMAIECIRIADDADNDFTIETNEDGTPFRKLNLEAIQRTRERIKTRQWAASKELPRKYGTIPAPIAAAPPTQLEAPPKTEDHVHLARQAVSQLFAARALAEKK